MNLSPGMQVTQNLRLARMLGQGGMGAVWIADHLTLRTQVAVKFILGDNAQNPEALERFSREATAAAQIKSPHVVQVFDHGVFGGLPYIVMELLEGEDLEARIERGPLRLDELAPILQQIAKALTQAHALGIVHRDIKPANVFLSMPGGDLLVKLLDFGVAKMTGPDAAAHKKTQTGQIIGTPCYMSPEQVFSRGAVDHKIDLWALSVLVYQSITGELPFIGNTLGDVYLAINACTFQRPSALSPQLPRELDAFFQRAFDKDPGRRFASARELSDAFAAIAARSPMARRSLPGDGLVVAPFASAPTGTAHTTPVMQTTPAGSRVPLFIAMALGGIAGVAGVFYMVGRQPRVDPPAVAAASDTSSASSAPPSTSATTPPATTAPEVSPATSATVAPVESASAAPAGTPVRPPPPPSSAKTAPTSSAKTKKKDHGF